MNTPAYRALCAELAGCLDDALTFTVQDDTERSMRQLITRARTLLAAPEVVGVRVTDEELDRWIVGQSCVPPSDEVFLDRNVYVYPMSMDELRSLTRAAISRYGTAHPAPVPVGERPWERDGWCDKKGRCWINQDPEGSMGNPTWRLVKHGEDGRDFTRYPRAILLPHWALPLPGAHG
jgi:hypothetical protein